MTLSDLEEQDVKLLFVCLYKCPSATVLTVRVNYNQYFTTKIVGNVLVIMTTNVHMVGCMCVCV